MPDNQPSPRALNAWALASELGFIIALPLVLLVIAGVKLDAYLGTTPLFIVVGLVGAALTSTVAIARKIKRLNL